MRRRRASARSDVLIKEHSDSTFELCRIQVSRLVSILVSVPRGRLQNCPARFRKFLKANDSETGGRGGIRTHGGLAATTVFKTVSLNHSDTLPCSEGQTLPFRPHADKWNMVPLVAAVYDRRLRAAKRALSNRRLHVSSSAVHGCHGPPLLYLSRYRYPAARTVSIICGLSGSRSMRLRSLEMCWSSVRDSGK